MRPAPAGEVEVEVAFQIDDDGIFSASARDLETGQETRIEVFADSGLEDREISALTEEHARYLEQRRGDEQLEGIRQSIETLVANIAHAAERLGALVDLSADGKDALEYARGASQRATDRLESAGRGELAEHLVLLEDALNRLEPFTR